MRSRQTRTPLELIRYGVEAGDLRMVAKGYARLTGQAIKPPRAGTKKGGGHVRTTPASRPTGGTPPAPSVRTTRPAAHRVADAELEGFAVIRQEGQAGRRPIRRRVGEVVVSPVGLDYDPQYGPKVRVNPGVLRAVMELAGERWTDRDYFSARDAKELAGVLQEVRRRVASAVDGLAADFGADAEAVRSLGELVVLLEKVKGRAAVRVQ
jgi:hypothetical protein